MPRTETYRAKWEAPFPVSFTKAERVDTRKLLTKSILSRLEFDLARDKVNPAGIDWTLHKADHWIDLEHGRDLDVGDKPVAWAKESLSSPDAPYAVEYKSLDFAEPGEPALWETVPIGTDYFDPKSKLSMHIFAMRDQDALPCSSLEFLPVRGHFKAIGRTPLEPRPCMPDPYAAYQFDRCRVVRWTICAKGVCPHAMTLTKSAGTVSQVPSALEKILSDKCVNINGTREALHPYILKALAPADTPKRTTVTVERKAMEPDTMAAPAPDAPLETESAAAVDDMAGDDGVAHNGVTAIYSAGQTCEACADQCEADLENTDNPELYRDAMKLVAMQRALGEKWKALGDKHDAKIQAMKGGKEAPAESEDATADTSKDEDGTYKAVRRAYKPVLKAIHEHNVKRFRLADLQATEPVAKATETAAEPETLEQALERIRREDPEGWRRIQREQNLIDACS